MRPLAKEIQICLKQILGESCWITKPQPSKLKSGERVYRVTGHGNDLRREDGKVYYIDRSGKFPTDGPQFRQIEITRENLNEKRIRDLFFSDWEFFLLERGPETVEQELIKALAEKGHAVNVRIGGGVGAAYSTSIVVKQLAEPMKPGAFTDDAILGELASVSEELAEVHATVNDLALRLRSLLITMTLKAKL